MQFFKKLTTNHKDDSKHSRPKDDIHLRLQKSLKDYEGRKNYTVLNVILRGFSKYDSFDTVLKYIINEDLSSEKSVKKNLDKWIQIANDGLLLFGHDIHISFKILSTLKAFIQKDKRYQSYSLKIATLEETFSGDYLKIIEQEKQEALKILRDTQLTGFEKGLIIKKIAKKFDESEIIGEIREYTRIKKDATSLPFLIQDNEGQLYFRGRKNHRWGYQLVPDELKLENKFSTDDYEFIPKREIPENWIQALKSYHTDNFSSTEESQVLAHYSKRYVRYLSKCDEILIKSLLDCFNRYSENTDVNKFRLMAKIMDIYCQLLGEFNTFSAIKFYFFQEIPHRIFLGQYKGSFIFVNKPDLLEVFYILKNGMLCFIDHDELEEKDLETIKSVNVTTNLNMEKQPQLTDEQSKTIEAFLIKEIQKHADDEGRTRHMETLLTFYLKQLNNETLISIAKLILGDSQNNIPGIRNYFIEFTTDKTYLDTVLMAFPRAIMETLKTKNLDKSFGTPLEDLEMIKPKLIDENQGGIQLDLKENYQPKTYQELNESVRRILTSNSYNPFNPISTPNTPEQLKEVLLLSLSIKEAETTELDIALKKLVKEFFGEKTNSELGLEINSFIQHEIDKQQKFSSTAQQRLISTNGKSIDSHGRDNSFFF